jgi:mRNA interferase HigB
MRVIARKRLEEFWRKHWDAKTWLNNWYSVARHAEWGSLHDVRATFPQADLVPVGSGKSVTVFNVCGNKYRLVTAIHYNTGTVYVLRLMPHAEYSKNAWKSSL